MMHTSPQSRRCAVRTLALWLALSACQAPAASFTDELWRGIGPIYARILEHPFLQGLADGSLPRSRFEFYLIQDAHYLRRFSNVLSVLAAKAPREEWSITLNEDAVSALEAERHLHEEVLASYGVSPERIKQTPIAPAAYAYMSHLTAAAYERPFAEGLAAVLPCYWIYWEVGKELEKQGSPDADYQRWIEQYAGEEFGQAVERVLTMMDAEVGHLDARSRKAVQQAFERSARYEWMFWDMAWRQQEWPP